MLLHFIYLAAMAQIPFVQFLFPTASVWVYETAVNYEIYLKKSSNRHTLSSWDATNQ